MWLLHKPTIKCYPRRYIQDEQLISWEISREYRIKRVIDEGKFSPTTGLQKEKKVDLQQIVI